MTVNDPSDRPGSRPDAELEPPVREKPRLEPLDDLVLDDEAGDATVEVEAADIPPIRMKEPSRPSKKERVRPKITLRIPDDEVVRPEPKPERITRPDLSDGTDVLVETDLDEPFGGTHTRTSPAPPGVDSDEEIEVAIPSTPAVTTLALDSVPPDEPREFETLHEGPFAPDAEEDSWTPWQPTAIDKLESEALRAEAVPAVPAEIATLPEAELEELDVLAPTDEADIPVDVPEIAVDSDDRGPQSNPPEIDLEDMVVVEPAVVPPVRPRAPSVPTGLPPMRPAYVTPTSIGMESIPPDSSATRDAPPTIPQAPPPVHSAPQLHQVLAEGGPRVGSAPPSAPPLSEVKGDKKRIKPWWEELFNDDYLRTVGNIGDDEIAAEASFIEDSLGVAKGATVLDLACGTGRHAIELGKRGYQVVGFDLSLAMLARASEEAQDRGQKINFVQGDMREMTFEETFDGVYSWNTSFGFFDEEKNAAIVAKVHRALKKGGQFLLDVVNRDNVIRQSPSLAWYEGDGCICMDEMHIDWITSRMKVKRTLMMDDGRTKEIEYSIRVYSLHELGKLLHDNGFRVAEVSGRTSTPGVFFGCEAPRTLILAEKR